MSEVTKPEFLEAQYKTDVGLWTVQEDGYLDSDFVVVPELSTEAVMDLDVDFRYLAWVSFYKRAQVKIKHIKPTKVTSEVVTGSRVEWAPDQFVIDLANGQPVFDTEASILERGELSPHMTNWLNRLADNPRTGSTVEWAFEDLLGRSLH